MNKLPRKRWGCLHWGIMVVLLGCLFMFYQFISAQRAEEQMKAKNNCEQIILCLKQYAADAGSVYPDGRLSNLNSANQAFREFFKKEIISDERIFGCPNSVFNPDNEIGHAPSFEKALLPGECHWMLLKHQTANAHAKTPIIIENSLNASWPPKWNVSFWAGKKRGRAWYEERAVIVGRNDGSVSLEKLKGDGTMDWHSPPNLGPDGKSWIDALTPDELAKLSYWDIKGK